MNASEIKRIMLRSLDSDADPREVAGIVERETGTIDFKKGFSDRVLDKLAKPGLAVVREVDFIRSMNIAFYRIAITGVAAIVLLLISIFLMEGSLSFNSFLGLSGTNDDSIVYLLTGN
jgi:hypothetical protein